MHRHLALDPCQRCTLPATHSSLSNCNTHKRPVVLNATMGVPKRVTRFVVLAMPFMNAGYMTKSTLVVWRSNRMLRRSKDRAVTKMNVDRS